MKRGLPLRPGGDIRQKVKRNLVQGCVITALLLGASIGVIIMLLWDRVPYAFLFFGGLPLGGWLMAGIAFTGSAIKKIGLRQSLTPRSSLPGKAARICIVGTIHPVSNALRAPFTNRPCIAYSYDIYSWVNVASQSNVRPGNLSVQRRHYYEGMHLCPSEIRGLTVQAKILAMPIMDMMAGTEGSKEAGLTFISKTTFTQRPHKDIDLMQKLDELIDMVADDDGEMGKDWCHKVPDDERGLIFEERIIPVGTEVSAIGYYDPAADGFVPEASEGLRLFVGGLKLTQPSLIEIVRGFLGGLAIAASAVGVALVPWMFPGILG